MLPVMDAFYTIQGEGYNTGKAAYFIRIGGCDVGCHWCDTRDSWNAEAHQLTPIDFIVEDAAEHSAKIAVITGGEPLMYNLDQLTGRLIEKGIKTHLETSGAYPLSGKWHWICLSPKKIVPPVGDIHSKADELKVIFINRQDFKRAEEQAAKVSESCKLYLQPEWGRIGKVLPLIVDFVKYNPKWSISLQTQKYMDIP
ncbi:MAG: 7-carboxy-7-deazaguanine synthase QueE [Bacteroidota bacterium]